MVSQSRMSEVHRLKYVLCRIWMTVSRTMSAFDAFIKASFARRLPQLLR
jgi:hypothetical protein